MTGLRKRGVCYLVAALLLAVAVVGPPLDRLSDASFAWHMFQHVLLLFAVPLLLVLARPFEIFAALAGKARAARFVRATRPFHAVAGAPVALACFAGTLWLTHFSALYQLALTHFAAHLAEHALYVSAGLLFWAPVLAPPPLRPLAYPARLLYLAVALPQGALLAMAINSAHAPLYAHYAAVAASPQAALADQSNAAAVMWILGGLIVFSAFLGTIALWAKRESDSKGDLTLTKAKA